MKHNRITITPLALLLLSDEEDLALLRSGKSQAQEQPLLNRGTLKGRQDNLDDLSGRKYCKEKWDS
ncbi:MAG: hypothetical protein ABW085_02415 [Sedimenticola sp.]